MSKWTVTVGFYGRATPQVYETESATIAQDWFNGFKHSSVVEHVELWNGLEVIDTHINEKESREKTRSWLESQDPERFDGLS